MSPLVEIGLTDLPKSGCAMAHPAHPGMTGLCMALFQKQRIKKDMEFKNNLTTTKKRVVFRLLRESRNIRVCQYFQF